MAKKKVVRRARKKASSDFLPAGVTREAAPVRFTGPLCTYLLSCDKRGHAEISVLPDVLMSKHKGYRAIVLGRPGLELETTPHTQVVGKKSGNHYDDLMGWALTNRIAELHQQHAESGGASAKVKREALRDYEKARHLVDAAHKAAHAAEHHLNQQSEAMVVAYGHGAVVIEGEEHIASIIRERVYWRYRPVMPQDAAEVEPDPQPAKPRKPSAKAAQKASAKASKKPAAKASKKPAAKKASKKARKAKAEPEGGKVVGEAQPES